MKTKHVFETERLRVFLLRGAVPAPWNDPRDIYIAMRSDVDRPMVAATATLWKRQGEWFIDWLEVSTEYRREGFATELLEALRQHLDAPIVTTPGSEDGEAFLDAIEAGGKD
jgi:ribosomal protein S18 acetylase RimI-like enzyme